MVAVRPLNRSPPIRPDPEEPAQESDPNMNAERIPTPKNRSLQTLKTVLAAATLATLAACSSTGSTSGDGSSGSGGSGTGAYGASAGGQYGSGGAYGSGGPAGGYVGGPGATQEQRVVYFDYDSADIRADSRPIIQAHAQYLQQTPGSVAILEGHADERGSREYNIALGERRSVAVRRAMEALGVQPNQMRTVSYGEERPAVGGHDESAYAQNRRVEIAY
ncbi:MAG TPA: peptidoglycan-associated lipoprotein Pal [Plasticicumulans sp.]|nr:peptidoglycan-associated lipoprotein Pal [Plasticicumulans sp.]HNO61738.1 peptidoglycan-associated lipoprotein Pal [Plasticicumulans sp.]